MFHLAIRFAVPACARRSSTHLRTPPHCCRTRVVSCIEKTKHAAFVAVGVLLPFAGASQGALLVEFRFDAAMSCAAIGTPQRLKYAGEVPQRLWRKLRMASVTALLAAVRQYIFWREPFPNTWRAHAESAAVLRMMQHALVELCCGKFLLTCVASEAFRFVRALCAPLCALDK